MICGIRHYAQRSGRKPMDKEVSNGTGTLDYAIYLVKTLQSSQRPRSMMLTKHPSNSQFVVPIVPAQASKRHGRLGSLAQRSGRRIPT